VRVDTVEETLEAIERVVKWVVQKVDTKAYADRIEAEKRVALLRAKIARAEKAAREALELEKAAVAEPRARRPPGRAPGDHQPAAGRLTAD
jgi:hypothetical protein